MQQLKNILVGLDFSPCSAAALDQAVRLSAYSDAKVKALCVIPEPLLTGSTPPWLKVEMPDTNLLLTGARERWERWRAARNLPASVDFDAVVGSAYGYLIERVKRDAIDLLAIGAHSESQGGTGVGSTASTCIQRAESRVLVVRDAQRAPFKSIVACIDFSPASALVIEEAISLAVQEAATLKILHIYVDPWRRAAPMLDPQAGMRDLAARFQRVISEQMREICRPVERELTAIKADSFVIEAEAHGKGILDFLRSRRSDLAILATRSRWDFHDFFWGSTAQRVVRDAPCSVLTVKPPDFAAPDRNTPHT